MDERLFLHPEGILNTLGLEPGMQVADFGAGSGFFTHAAARAVGPTGVVWAVDINPDLLARIKNSATTEGLQNIEIVQGDLEKKEGSRLPAGQFDVVIASNVLFAAEGKLAFVREIARVLAPQGRALILDWRDSFDGLGPHPDHIITTGAARDICEKGGLVYGGDIPAGAFHWAFVAHTASAT